MQYVPGQPPAVKSYNLNDTPCPPPDFADRLTLGEPYEPILFPFMNITREFDVCSVAAVRDPPMRAVRVGDITGRNDDDDSIV